MDFANCCSLQNEFNNHVQVSMQNLKNRFVYDQNFHEGNALTGLASRVTSKLGWVITLCGRLWTVPLLSGRRRRKSRGRKSKSASRTLWPGLPSLGMLTLVTQKAVLRTSWTQITFMEWYVAKCAMSEGDVWVKPRITQLMAGSLEL